MLDVLTPLINFLIAQQTSHPTSQTTLKMGLELLVHLLGVIEANGDKFARIGQFTKQNQISDMLYHLVFALKQERQSGYNSEQYRVHMKVIHRLLSLHEPADTIVLIKHVLMGDLDDDLYSVIIHKMIKPQLNKENDLMLEFCLEEVLPKTLNVLDD